MFDQLFGAAMQQTHMRIGALDHLAIHLQHKAQHAMRRWMLRPEIHGDWLDLHFRHGRLSYSPLPALSAGLASI